MGKTNLDQFASGLVGTRTPFGVAANAFDNRFIPGGSSSGSAPAVGLRLLSFALGTDTAGSGRVPAGYNGCVGVKGTVGKVSTVGEQHEEMLCSSELSGCLLCSQGMHGCCRTSVIAAVVSGQVPGRSSLCHRQCLLHPECKSAGTATLFIGTASVITCTTYHQLTGHTCWHAASQQWLHTRVR